MDKNKILFIIDKIHNFAKKSDTDLIIVGSVAHTYDGGRNISNNETEPDDLDCIFVYSDIVQLKNHPLVSANTLTYYIENKTELALDLLSVKQTVNNINISADFISIEYLRQLSQEPYNGASFFRRKLNDSEENESNDYYDFAGNMYHYIKPHKKTSLWNIYTLPTKLFINGIFFPGVLLNKFIHSPILDFVNNKEIIALCRQIFHGFVEYAEATSNNDPNYNITKSIRNFDKFCDRAKKDFFGL
ncbi:MAG: hypothetical protein LBS60_06090 [Deltaproteobacteria bacterium]|jgi:hypothetical protein|nr:hypothetical protein [Deltaproteobacteria bacterium]